MTLDFCLRLEPNDLCHVMSVMSCPAISWPLMIGLNTWSAFQFAKLANASSAWRTVLKTPQNQQNYVLMSKGKIKNSGGRERTIALWCHRVKITLWKVPSWIAQWSINFDTAPSRVLFLRAGAPSPTGGALFILSAPKTSWVCHRYTALICFHSC